MSEQRRIKQMERLAHEAAAKANRKPWWQSGWSLLMAAITIGGAYIAVIPRPVITPTSERNPTQPLKLIVTLTNTNIIPLEDVKVFLTATT